MTDKENNPDQTVNPWPQCQLGVPPPQFHCLCDGTGFLMPDINKWKVVGVVMIEIKGLPDYLVWRLKRNERPTVLVGLFFFAVVDFSGLDGRIVCQREPALLVSSSQTLSSSSLLSSHNSNSGL